MKKLHYLNMPMLLKILVLEERLRDVEVILRSQKSRHQRQNEIKSKV